MYNAKPIIGLTGSFMIHQDAPLHTLGESYFRAVRQFGGIPLLIPVLAEEAELKYLIDQCDGLILTGGLDIDPALFGETILNDTVIIASERDQAEYRVLELAEKKDIPLLGICRGIQMLNVFYGGTLYQDLPAQMPTEVNHRMEKPYHRTCHSCILEPGTPLQELLKSDRIGVNSHHHQAVKTVAPGFSVMGHSEDGVIEAIFHTKKVFCWGIQWHPERIWDLEKGSEAIFSAFIDATRQ